MHVEGRTYRPLDPAYYAWLRTRLFANLNEVDRDCTREFNRRSTVPMNTFMPGLVKTKILANEPQPMRAIVKLAKVFFGLPVEKSAAEVVQVVDNVARNGRRDGYYSRTKLKPPRDLKMMPGDGEKLWALTGQLLRPYVGR